MNSIRFSGVGEEKEQSPMDQYHPENRERVPKEEENLMAYKLHQQDKGRLGQGNFVF